MTPILQLKDALLNEAAIAIGKASDALLAMQDEQGYWWGDLTADTTLESDYILLQLWLHPPVDGVWNPPSRDKVLRAADSILKRQLPGGGFNIYAGGPADVSATVKAYFALKLAGISEADPRLVTARDCVLSLGGIQAANNYVKINLSLFGQFPRECCPSIPPEMMMFPGNFIYQMSSWTRAIVIPLSIIHAFNPHRPVPAGFTIDELFVPGGTSYDWLKDRQLLTWRNIFLSLDKIAKFCEKHGPKSLRKRAIHKAEQWMLERTKYSDGLAAIYPSMQYIIMALDLLGYSPDHPDRAEAERQFNALLVEDRERFFFQPCFSPVWDTAIAAYALGEAESAPASVMTRSVDWLLTKEVRRKGDWSVKRPHTEPSGWYFEFANEFYPDIDDTAMVLLGMSHGEATNPEAQKACTVRAIKWLIDMQGKDGGWAAFDVDNNWEALSHVPFADHNAMLDPSCPDITGRVLEALCLYGVAQDSPAVQRGVEFLLRTQEQDGSWYGRWGVNYVYGAFLALRGLRAAGVSDREACVLRAGEWLRSIQNADGGWGESCASYDNECFTPAPSTPSQTAWAILGLLASGDETSGSLQNGIEYLVETQKGDGTWDEHSMTGTGFPRVFYLSYHLYRNSFPLLALAAYKKCKSR